MSSTVADLFDAMAATYDDLEPWYEHFYARLHTILRAELGHALRPAAARSTPAAAPASSRRFSPTSAGRRTASTSRPACSRSRASACRRPASRRQASRHCHSPTRCFDAVVCCGSTLSFVDDPARALSELGRVLRPGGRLLLDCEHRPSLDLAWTLASAVAGDPLGYGVSARAAWRAVFARDGVRLPYPGYGLLRLFRRRELDRMLAAAGLGPSARGACTGSPTCCRPRCCTAPGRRAGWPPPTARSAGSTPRSPPRRRRWPSPTAWPCWRFALSRARRPRSPPSVPSPAPTAAAVSATRRSGVRASCH